MEKVNRKMNGRVSDNLTRDGDGANILALGLSDVRPVSYQVLTDGDGTVFMECVAGYMRQHLPQEAAKKIYERYRENTEVEQSGAKEDSVQNAQNALDEARRAAEEERADEEDGTKSEQASPVQGGGDTKAETEKENPIELVLRLKQNEIGRASCRERVSSPV